MEMSLVGSPRMNFTCHLYGRATFQPVKSDSQYLSGLFHFLPSPASLPSLSRGRSLPEQRVSVTAHLPISPEFLTLLAPVMDDEAQPKEDQPQYEAPNTTQHLALGRFRLCPWGAEPECQHLSPHLTVSL